MMSVNETVRKVYEAGEYTDAKGFVWVRGMDGWFLQGQPDDAPIFLSRHHDMVAMIERENPDDPGNP